MLCVRAGEALQSDRARRRRVECRHNAALCIRTHTRVADGCDRQRAVDTRHANVTDIGSGSGSSSDRCVHSARRVRTHTGAGALAHSGSAQSGVLVKASTLRAAEKSLGKCVCVLCVCARGV
jgi:hypothetical protein